MPTTVLFIDDSVSMRQMTSLILSGAGYEVVQASDGKEGLEKLTEDIDLVITDYNMPGMNGVEVIRSIRGGEVNKSVPVLMLTTESEEAKKQEGREAGATAWMTKPFDKDGLLATVKKITDSVEF
jgi:two-component system chemotaxis response regulator CheY